MDETHKAPQVYSSKPDFLMIENEADSTETLIFNENSMFETPFGFAEGYFRELKNRPEYLEWSVNPEIFNNETGRWEKEKKISTIPWPLVRSDEKIPAYYYKFLEKLSITETNLYQLNSFLKEESSMHCVLCNYKVPRDQLCHFVLKLDAYESKTELRWPAIYFHYLNEHHVLPSVMFVTIFLEHRPSS